MVLNPRAAGPARAGVAIVPGHSNGRDVVPGGVAMVGMVEGKTVRLLFSAEEARAAGEMLLVCGCVAAGGMPPTEAPPPTSPLVGLNGGRH